MSTFLWVFFRKMQNSRNIFKLIFFHFRQNIIVEKTIPQVISKVGGISIIRLNLLNKSVKLVKFYIAEIGKY